MPVKEAHAFGAFFSSHNTVILDPTVLKGRKTVDYLLIVISHAVIL